ncbi:MAG: helix-turn-helix domain-containing protein [Chloroflexota bacterium]
MAIQRHLIGGLRIRALRERVGKSQLLVEADADLGSGYLQRIEVGKVRQPTRTTLERILAALNARFSEQRDILELYGYTVAITLPSEDDIRWARAACASELHGAPLPAYLLDCGHRLLDWNAYLAQVFNHESSEAGLAVLTGRCILYAWFAPEHWLASRIVNQTAFLRAVTRFLRHEQWILQAEDWYNEHTATIRADLPTFASYWDQALDHEAYALAGRVLVPVQVAVPGVGVLQFRLASETFTQDNRFRLVYYLPADEKTMQQCVVWMKEQG